MSYTFDGNAKIISIVAQTTMSVRDVYSRWADWYATNAQWLPAFATVGGDTIDAGAGTSIPIYAYLVNGWRIRPQESSHTLNVSNGVLLVEGGGDPFINTLGAFVVRVNYQQPVQAIGVSGGGSGGATAAQVWQHVIEAGYTAEEILRILTAVLAGATTGGPGSPAYKSIDGSKTRVTGTADASGNRTGVSLDGDP